MKILKPRYDLAFLFYPIFLLIAIAVYNFYFPMLLHLALVNWVLDLIVLIFIFFPFSKIKLTEKKVITSTLFWWTIIFISQFLINYLLWSLAQILFWSHSDLTTPTYFNIFTYVISSGLFPFGLMGCLCLMIGYYVYIKNQPPYFSSAYQSLFKNNYLDSVGITVDTYMRLIIYYCLIFCLGMLAIHLISVIQYGLNLNIPSGVTIKVFLIGSILILLASNEYTIRFLHCLQSWNFPLFVIALLLVFFMSTSYVGLSVLSNYLDAINPHINDEQYLKFDSRYLANYLSVILTFVWIGLASILSAVVVAISRGRSLRKIILVSLITNLLSWCVIYFFSNLITSRLLLIVTNILCLLFLLMIILRNKNFTYFMRATFPSSTPIKVRSTFYFIKNLPLILALFICIYYTLGIYFLSLSAALVLLPCFVIILIGLVNFIFE